ncbi:hypothetical protein ACFLXH_03940, partial [Chloroflexota bacterium]
LKRAGYLKNNKKRAEPDWDKFSKDERVKTEFNETIKDIKPAIEYLKSKPPKIQIQDNCKLSWDERTLREGDLEACIDAVKRVRNNLFHGGKFPKPTGPVEDPSRNNELIKHSTTILKHLLNSAPEVKRLYEEPL